MSDTQKETEEMRANPEVMGRTEPLETDGTIWPEMRKFKQRFNDIQSEFIEEPRAAVTKAEQLIEEARRSHREVDARRDEANAWRRRIRRRHGEAAPDHAQVPRVHRVAGKPPRRLADQRSHLGEVALQLGIGEQDEDLLHGATPVVLDRFETDRRLLPRVVGHQNLFRLNGDVAIVFNTASEGCGISAFVMWVVPQTPGMRLGSQ